MKLVLLLLLASLITAPGADARDDPCEVDTEGRVRAVCRGPTNEGAGCVALVGNWTGAGCGLVGFNCFSVIWGIHNDAFSVGGYSSCQAGVFVHVPKTG